MRTVERIADWKRDPDGTVHFSYRKCGKEFVFHVSDNPQNGQPLSDTVRLIRRMALNPACELGRDDAEFLTEFVSEVVGMECTVDRTAPQRPSRVSRVASVPGPIDYAVGIIGWCGVLVAWFWFM